ncbi:hypothetical protein UPYG_G00216070 [Umbra pygmaea]|uniref:THD domain-containing protein n=1 Tax=Umbra pygmaea TaxID=75934 RepID=A0ABD0X8N9_UMBPY
MINTFHSSLPPPIPPRLGSGRPGPAQNKPLLRFLIGVVMVQMTLVVVGFIYLYHMENLYHKDLTHKYLDDMIILRRLEDCEKDSQLLLDCTKLLETYKNVLAKVSQAEGKAAKITGNMPSVGAMARMIVKGPVSSSNYLEWNIKHSVLKNINYYKSSWLNVTQPGDYNIYAQVAFSKWHPKTPLASRVKLRKGEDQEEVVLMTAYCALGKQNQSETCTAFQAGVFNLETGDQLSVWVTDPILVNYEVESTTFGLYRL